MRRSAFGFYPQPVPIDENHPRAAYPGYYAFSKVMEEAMAEQYGIQYGVPEYGAALVVGFRA